MKTKITLLFISLILVGVVSGQPVSSFVADDSTGCFPFNVQFTDSSTNAISWHWDFGDGNTSTLENPSHTYTIAGNFDVTLIVWAGNGQTDTLIVDNLISVGNPPVAAFTATGTTGCPNTNLVSFTNSSTNSTTYLWDFGDGNTSTQVNPTHTYTTPGNYHVTLLATNSYGCNNAVVQNSLVQITTPPLVEFAVDTTFACDTSKVFSFTNLSGNGVSWHWDFGDGNYASTSNTTHQYSTAGNYDVSLTVTGTNGCTATLTKNNLLEVKQGFVPPFHLNTNENCGPITIFLHTDVTGMASYHWDLGDNSTSTLEHPKHYYQPGTYSITHTVTDTNGCVYSNTKDSLLTIYTKPNVAYSLSDSVGCAPLNITFTDNTIGGVAWRWVFGDGDTSYLQHPTHTYTNSGNYDASLTVYSEDTIPYYAPNGCWQKLDLPTNIIVNEAQVDYTVSDSIGCPPLAVNFYDASANAVSWFWDFGDGNTSTLQNPSHTYTNSGNYTVSLVINDQNGCTDTVVYTNKIKVTQQNLAYNVPPAVEACKPFTANFNASNFSYNSWYWDFGDGDTAITANPTHTYNSPGTYVVSLQTEAANGCPAYIDTFAVYKISGIEAAFGYDITNCPDFEVQFYDSSQNAISWFWDFGDGNTSTLHNPIHQYAGGGFYTVKLTVANAQGCSDTKIKVNAVVLNPCQPNGPMNGGNASNTGGGFSIIACAPLTIDFNNPYDSTIAWHWNFGDGDTSNLENPSHTYTSSGSYDLTLVVEYSNGNYDTLQIDSHLVTTKPVAKFVLDETILCQTLEVEVLDSSINAKEWYYDFGDGNNSTLQNPTHTYTGWGNYYNILLTVEDTVGCKSNTAQNVFAGLPPANFTYKKDICLGDTVWFSSNLSGYNSYTWYFGDGDSSNAQVAWHVYNSAGNYQPELLVKDSGNCTYSHTLPNSVRVYEPVPSFGLSGPLATCHKFWKTFTNLSTNYDSLFWDFGNGNTYWGSNPPQQLYNIVGNYIVTLTAYKNGCSKTYQSPDTIKVVPKPAVDFTYTQNQSCFPVTVTFNNLSQHATHYSWSFGDGNNSTTTNPVHTYYSMPTYDIQLIAFNDYGCQTSIIKPKIQLFEPTLSISDTVACVGEVIAFSSATNGAASWYWDFGDGNTSTLQNPTHTYTSGGVYDVSLIIQSIDGCIDTLHKFSAISVGNPQAEFVSPTPANCAPSAVSFTNLSTNATGWQWSFGDSAFSTQQHPGHIYTMPGSYSIKLIVTDTLGCSDTSLKVNYVEVYGPIADFSITGQSGCEPVSVSFSDSSWNAVNWKWSFGDGDTSNLKNPVHTYYSPGNYVISLEVEDSLGCKSITVNNDTVSVFPNPIAAFNVSDSTGCLPLNVVFTNQSSNATSYLWKFGNGDTSIIQNPNYTYNIPGSFVPTLITKNSYGCADTLVGQHIQVSDVPKADFQVMNNSGCPPFTLDINNLSNGQISSYKWWMNNNLVSTDSIPNITLQASGTYTIKLEVVNALGCVDTMMVNNAVQVFNADTPKQVPIKFVSVMSDKSVRIEWEESTDVSFQKYMLYRKDTSGVFKLIDSIFDAASVVYIESGLNTLQNTYCYKLQTVGQCSATLPLSGLTTHCTMNVEALPLTEGGIKVSWSPYIGAAIDKYQLYRLDGSGNMTVHVAEIDTGTTDYIDENGICPKLHRYKVVAENVGGTDAYSLSDTSHAMPVHIIGEQNPEIIRTTVADNEYTLTEWLPPANYPEKVLYYNIYRSLDTVNFEFVDQVEGHASQYLDYNVEVSEENYYYQIEVINVCETTAGKSGPGSSILLTVDKKGEDKHLQWTDYRKWENGVEEYRVEKKHPNGEWEAIKKVKGNTTQYTDPY